jgi:hypothetical protein
MLMEDVGVTAYHGAAPLISSKKFLDAAAGILAVEAYHMGMARSVLYRMGTEAREAANALSDARDKLDGAEDVDQGIVMDGKAQHCSVRSRWNCLQPHTATGAENCLSGRQIGRVQRGVVP